MHTQLDDPEGPSLEDIEGTDEDREKEVVRRLQTIADSKDHKKVLILKNSHVGGHKFAGNVVVSSTLIARLDRPDRRFFFLQRFTHLRGQAFGTDACRHTKCLLW